ncbi:hypothetical protein BDR22DRAFT_876200 [Usnea florida]
MQPDQVQARPLTAGADSPVWRRYDWPTRCCLVDALCPIHSPRAGNPDLLRQ